MTVLLLTEALQRHTLTLFLGADLPRALTGVPSRAELARALAHQHGLDERASLARVAQQVGRGGYRREFTVFLREALTGVAPQPFHRRVAAFAQEHGLQTLITTAYDDLLKRAFNDAGIPVECVWKDSQLAVALPERPLLIQLYGAPLTDVESLVVTEDDHLGLGRDRARESVLDEVRRALQRNTVLFLGYDLSDPDFQLLWREILSRAGDLHRRAFAVWPGLPAAEAGVWADRGIVILEAEPWGLVSSREASPDGPLSRPSAETDIILSAPLPSEEPVKQRRKKDRQIAADCPNVKVSCDIILERTEDELDWAGIRLRGGQGGHEGYLVIVRQNRVLEIRLAEGTGQEPALARYELSASRAHLTVSIIGSLISVQVDDTQVMQYRADQCPDNGSIFLEVCRASATFRHLVVERLSPPLESELWQDRKGQAGAGTLPGKSYHGIGKAWAVLVGVNQYTDPFIAGLQACVDDVTAIHGALAGRYQAARLLTDATPEQLPTRANILAELSNVAQAASEEDLLLFYFSGHGMAQDGESYLLARDTRLAALKHTAVAMRDVREIMEQSPAHAKVIVLDACHSGASIGKAEPIMTPEFIQRVFAEAEGMAVLASCKQGQQSWEWREQQRSVFTYYLLEALSGKADLDGKGFVTVSDTSRYVTDGVKAWAVNSGVSQTPTLQYTVAGDIILLRYGAQGGG